MQPHAKNMEFVERGSRLGEGRGQLACAGITLPTWRIFLPQCYNFLYIHVMAIKPLRFRGNSLEALREFSGDTRQVAGFQLDKVQRGLEPDDWKPIRRGGGHE
jgi:hypothetical protein